jgi:hypothetical protein
MQLMQLQDAAKSGIEWMSLENLWPLADYITVHVPLIKATENLINGRVLGLCKSNVKIINVARGGIVNEKELVEALNQGKAGGAAFDVFDEVGHCLNQGTNESVGATEVSRVDRASPCDLDAASGCQHERGAVASSQ